LNKWSKCSDGETIDLSFMSYTTNPNDATGTKRHGNFHVRTNGNKRNFSGSTGEEIVDTNRGVRLRSKQTNFEQKDHENLLFSTSTSTVEHRFNHGEPIITKVSILLSEHSKQGLLGEASSKDILVTSVKNGTTAFIQSVTKEALVNRLSEALSTVRKELINGRVDVALTSAVHLMNGDKEGVIMNGAFVAVNNLLNGFDIPMFMTYSRDGYSYTDEDQTAFGESRSLNLNAPTNIPFVYTGFHVRTGSEASCSHDNNHSSKDSFNEAGVHLSAAGAVSASCGLRRGKKQTFANTVDSQFRKVQFTTENYVKSSLGFKLFRKRISCPLPKFQSNSHEDTVTSNTNGKPFHERFIPPTVPAFTMQLRSSNTAHNPIIQSTFNSLCKRDGTKETVNYKRHQEDRTRDRIGGKYDSITESDLSMPDNN
jgi:hypothetical protein